MVRREERGPHGVQAARVLHKLERRKRLRDRRPAGGIRLVQAQGVPLEPGRQGRSSARSGCVWCRLFKGSSADDEGVKFFA